MKRIFLFTVLTVFVSTTLLAQFGAQVGGVLASINSKTAGEDDDFDSKAGFTVGLLYRKSLGGGLYFQPELNWTQKGAKIEEGGDKFTVSLNYLELPLNFVWMASASKGSANSGGFFLGLGPAFNFGMSGKYKYEGTISGEDDVKFGNSDDDDLKGFDIAGNIMAGYGMPGGINIALVYSHSFTNSQIDGDSDNSIRNSYIGLRLGYMFGADKK